MNNSNLFLSNQNKDSQNQTDSESAKLAVIPGVITTFGDALSTLAAALALEEAQQEQNNAGDSKNMQKQIDYLTSEIEKMKRQMNSPWG